MKILSVGECMIELAIHPVNQAQAQLGYGGDTLNTALYLARLLKGTPHQSCYATALGDDRLSRGMLEDWQVEGLNVTEVITVPNRSSGLYAINVDSRGERSFSYWRDSAPAKDYFEGEQGRLRIEALRHYDALYFSGISLAILRPEGRVRLLMLAQHMRQAGKMVAFDSNYRPQLWEEHSIAQANNAAALHAASLVLPSIDDLTALFPEQADNLPEFLTSHGDCEIALKRGGKQVDSFTDGAWQQVALEPVSAVVDTTAAGDSFNAGYLAVRLTGGSSRDAILAGHALASRVIQYQGARIPQEAMQDFVLSLGETP